MPHHTGYGASDRGGARVGINTVPKKNAKHNPDKPLPTRYWHQGFGTIKVMDTDVVPFATLATAVRIAEQAEANVKGLHLIIMAVNSGWGYYIAPKGDAR